MAPGTSPARHCLAVCMASTMIAYLVQYTIGYYGVITASTVTGSGKGYEPALWSSTPNVAICFSLPSTKAPLIDTILSTNQEFLIRAPESGLAEREPPRTNLDASASVSRKLTFGTRSSSISPLPMNTLDPPQCMTSNGGVTQAALHHHTRRSVGHRALLAALGTTTFSISSSVSITGSVSPSRSASVSKSIASTVTKSVVQSFSTTIAASPSGIPSLSATASRSITGSPSHASVTSTTSTSAVASASPLPASTSTTVSITSSYGASPSVSATPSESVSDTAHPSVTASESSSDSRSPGPSPSLTLATVNPTPYASSSDAIGSFNFTSSSGQHSSSSRIVDTVGIVCGVLTIAAIICACTGYLWARKQSPSKASSTSSNATTSSSTQLLSSSMGTLSLSDTSPLMSDGGVVTQPVHTMPASKRLSSRQRSRFDYFDCDGDLSGDVSDSGYISRATRSHVRAPASVIGRSVATSPLVELAESHIRSVSPPHASDHHGYFPSSREEFMQLIQEAMSAIQSEQHLRGDAAIITSPMTTSRRALREHATVSQRRKSRQRMVSTHRQSVDDVKSLLGSTASVPSVDSSLLEEKRAVSPVSSLSAQSSSTPTPSAKDRWRKLKQYQRELRRMELELLLDMKGTSRRRSRRRRHSRLTEGLLPGPPTAGTPAPEDKAVTSQPERTASPSSPAAIVTGNPTDDVMTSGLDGVILEAVNQLPGPTAN